MFFFSHLYPDVLTSSQNNLAQRAERLGYNIEVSSSGGLMKSLGAIPHTTAHSLLELLSFKATNRAKYFCSGMLDIAKYGHYALNEPLYTHFTSPLRRYADILVHRQLETVMQGGGVSPLFLMQIIEFNLSSLQRKSSLRWTAMRLPRSLSNVICEFCK